jgi:hypothetical protein
LSLVSLVVRCYLTRFLYRITIDRACSPFHQGAPRKGRPAVFHLGRLAWSASRPKIPVVNGSGRLANLDPAIPGWYCCPSCEHSIWGVAAHKVMEISTLRVCSGPCRVQGNQGFGQRKPEGGRYGGEKLCAPEANVAGSGNVKLPFRPRTSTVFKGFCWDGGFTRAGLDEVVSR